jgi:hypothetical protein
MVEDNGKERQSVDCSAIQWEGYLWLKRKVRRKRGKGRLCSVCTCRHIERLREWGFIILRTFLITHGAISLNVYTGNIKRLTIYNTLKPWWFGPLRHLVPFMTYAHSSVLFVLCLFGLYPLTFTSSKSFFVSFSHRDPALHFPTHSLLPRNVLTIFVWLTVITCPSHTILSGLISATRSEVI